MRQIRDSRLNIDMLERGRDTAFETWTSHMRAGNFSEAWQVSDEILDSQHDCSGLPRHLQTLWRGSSLVGKHVMVRCYRGLGDTIQFIRYASLVKALAAELTVCAPVDLIPLLKTISTIDRITVLDRDADPPDYDCEIEITELPYIFRSTLEIYRPRFLTSMPPERRFPQVTGWRSALFGRLAIGTGVVLYRQPR